MIEARGLLATSDTDADIEEAHRLTQRFKAIVGTSPLRRLQHRYLEIVLAARQRSQDAEQQAQDLWHSPDWAGYPYQVLQVVEIQHLVRRILAGESSVTMLSAN